MARRLRFAPPGYWLHLTQRGNNQQLVFSSDADRQYFLGLLESRSEEREVRIAAYTLMTNHFHIVAAGDQVDAISLFMMDVNCQYAIYRNATQRTTGHIWQHRFYSCVLDDVASPDRPLGRTNCLRRYRRRMVIRVKAVACGALVRQARSGNE